MINLIFRSVMYIAFTLLLLTTFVLSFDWIYGV